MNVLLALNLGMAAHHPAASSSSPALTLLGISLLLVSACAGTIAGVRLQFDPPIERETFFVGLVWMASTGFGLALLPRPVLFGWFQLLVGVILTLAVIYRGACREHPGDHLQRYVFQALYAAASFVIAFQIL